MNSLTGGKPLSIIVRKTNMVKSDDQKPDEPAKPAKQSEPSIEKGPQGGEAPKPGMSIWTRVKDFLRR